MHHVFSTSSASWAQELRSGKTAHPNSREASAGSGHFPLCRTCCRGQLLRIGCLLCRLQQREVQVNKQVQLKEEVKRWLTIFHHMYKHTVHYINILKSTFAKSSKSQSWINQNPAGGCCAQGGLVIQWFTTFHRWRNQNRSPKKNLA